MIQFHRDQAEYFLSVVRKYMHLRGGLSQKDLAERIDVSISTLSRFLNQKSRDVDEQVVAKIVADLVIPLHEIVEFIVEQDVEAFKRLVQLYKEQFKPKAFVASTSPLSSTSSTASLQTQEERSKQQLEEFREKLGRLAPRQKAFIADLLELESGPLEMVVEVGEVVMRYVKSQKMSF